MNSPDLDALDLLAAVAFDGFLVRKDLVRKYSRQFPVPTYVVEFMLGRYCATVDEEEIQKGLAFVEKQLRERTVPAGTERKFISDAREKGAIKIIDIVRARLDTKSDMYLVELPSLGLRDARIGEGLVRAHERMLTDGFYGEVTLGYDSLIAQEKNGRPFEIQSIKPIQLSKSDALDVLKRGRQHFNLEQWRDFLLRSIGFEPSGFDERGKWVALLRMAPFVTRNFNLVELGPRGTGKSHLYQQVSPYSHLISGGKATVAKMFVNNASGQKGLVCHYDVVCFDEVSGISFDSKDGVNIMKGYMASGEFSRGKDSIRAEGGIVMVGNFDVDVQQQQRISHLFGPLPPEMRDDTAFMDRIHAYAPGWDFPKLNPGDHFTNHFGLVSDFLADAWNKLRGMNRLTTIQNRVHFGGALSGRDIEAVNKSLDALLKLLFPDPEMEIQEDDLEAIVRYSLESRRRVKEQQKKCFKTEFRNTHFSYILGVDGSEKYVNCPELRSDSAIEPDPLPPGQVWAMAPGLPETGPSLHRIEVSCGKGSGLKILNQKATPAFRESAKVGEQNLYARSKEYVGERDPRMHEFSMQLLSFDNDQSGGGIGLAALVSMVSALLERSTKGGLVVIGELNLGGSMAMVSNPVAMAEAAVEKGATTLLMPVTTRKALIELPDDLATKISVEFYKDAPEGVFKALVE